MNSLRQRIAALLAIVSLTSAPAIAATDPWPIAGLVPWQRPAQAPRLKSPPSLNPKDALQGVSEPIPPSLRFLDDQGGWYTPFTQPGMTGPYDLRGWHVHPPSSRQNKK